MKALTLQQPHATLGVLGLKIWETRSKPTKFRGRHLITSSAKWKPEYLQCLMRKEFAKALQGQIFTSDKMGAIIGSVELADCVSTAQAIYIMQEDVKAGRMAYGTMKDTLAFGDFGEGRFAYRWKYPVLFERPIPIKGALGFWDTRKQRTSYEIIQKNEHCFDLRYLGEHVGAFSERMQAASCIALLIQGYATEYINSSMQQIENSLFQIL